MHILLIAIIIEHLMLEEQAENASLWTGKRVWGRISQLSANFVIFKNNPFIGSLVLISAKI